MLRDDSVLNSISDGVIISASSGDVLKCNQKTRVLLGLPTSCESSEVVSAIDQAGLKRALGGQTGSPSGQFIFKTAGNKVVEIRWSTFKYGAAQNYTITVLCDTTPQIQVDKIQSEFIASIT
jgi:signal transduction histidine kinase